MKRKELYELMDIESAEDFSYFENLAALLECEEDLEYEDVAELIASVDMLKLAELLDDYFEEITEHIPAAETEVFTVFEKIRHSLVGMARNSSEESVVPRLAEEIERFRRWYSIDSRVFIKQGGDTAEKIYTLRDAILLSRLERIDGSSNEYDFTEAKDYELEEYVMSFADMLALAEQEEGGEAEYDEADDRLQTEIERKIFGGE